MIKKINNSRKKYIFRSTNYNLLNIECLCFLNAATFASKTTLHIRSSSRIKLTNNTHTQISSSKAQKL